MNDIELDRLLDSWRAPEPPAGLRSGLRARFPRAERRRIGRPLRWVAAVAVASVVLAVGMAQTASDLAPYDILSVVRGWYDAFRFGFEAHRYGALAIQIRDSHPRVTIDGQPAVLEYREGMVFQLDVPGDGAYLVTAGDFGEKGWTRAGRIDGSALRFDAGAHHVIVECGEPLMISDAPVFVRRR